MRIAYPVLLAVLLFPSSAFAQTAETLFTETFDVLDEKGVPPGWQYSADSTWQIDAGSPDGKGSGGNNLRHKGTHPGWVQTGAVDLSGLTVGTLRYRARRTASYAPAQLVVTASMDGGASFPVTLLAEGVALPGVDSRYEEVVVALPEALLGSSEVIFRFEAQGGQSGSANLRLDDVTVYGAAAGGQFGFASAFSTLPEAPAPLAIPLSLVYAGGVGLQALQVEAVWDRPGLRVASVRRGPALADESTWTVSYTTGEGIMKLVLLHNGTEGLPAGRYEDLLTLELAYEAEADSEATPVRIELRDLVTAQAVATGAAADIDLGTPAHAVAVTPPIAYFVPDAEQYDIGTVRVGQFGQAEIKVSNPDGTTALVIQDVHSTHPAFAVSPQEATIAPGETAVFDITYTPARQAFGHQRTALTFVHNGEAEVGITVSARGVGGIGDLNRDGLVDAVDLVQAIDFVLAAATPDEEQETSADLYPYEAGDGRLDVRDLTVLAQALAHGVWPDGHPLPALPEPPADKTDGEVTVQEEPTPTGTRLLLETRRPVRALQLVLHAEGMKAPPVWAAAPEGATLLSSFDAATGMVRLLVYRSDGAGIAPGTYALAEHDAVSLMARYAIAVDAEGQGLKVGFGAVVPTGVAVPGLPEGFRLDRPYPNPFRSAEGRGLRLPLTLPAATTVDVAVFDALGRRVAFEHQPAAGGEGELLWDGCNDSGQPVAPGLYVVRVEAGVHTATQPVVVVR